ncbi:MAG: hypothetical protein D6812_06955 [Deltaproteobacteria bacterium]|nr:MAG: hypothetical protein D6812_06955 [Deltaproteobacteria bacterium]
MKRWQTTILAILFLIPGISGFHPARAATAKAFGTAINLAGRQRMLTQKMSKEFLLVALGVDVEENRKNLRQTIDLFDGTLKQLLSGDAAAGIPAPPDPSIATQLQKVADLWGKFKPAVAQALSQTKIPREAIDTVERLNLPLLREMNEAVGLYEAASAKAGFKSLGKVVNIAGRQRMLTQKMAKEAFLIALGVHPDENREMLKKTRDLFENSHRALLAGDATQGIPPTKDPAIRTQMETVGKLWKEYRQAIDQVLGASSVPKDLIQRIAALNPKVLAEMHKAVGMYAR